MLVAGAFRTAYAHSQSPSTSTRHAAAIDTQQSDEVSRRQAHMSSVSCHVDELTADGRRQRRDVTQQHQQPTDVMSVRVVAKNIVLRSVSVKRGLRVFYPQNLPSKFRPRRTKNEGWGSKDARNFLYDP